MTETDIQIDRQIIVRDRLQTKVSMTDGKTDRVTKRQIDRQTTDSDGQMD